MEKLAVKQEELKKVETKIKKLNEKKTKLMNEIKILEMEAKSEQYAALEITLSEKGMSITELLETLK